MSMERATTTAPAPAEVPRPSRSRLVFRRARRILNIIAVLLCLLLLAQLILLPWIVRRQVASAFVGLGLRDVHFNVRDATPWGAEISDIRAGTTGRARINRV